MLTELIALDDRITELERLVKMLIRDTCYSEKTKSFIR